MSPSRLVGTCTLILAFFSPLVFAQTATVTAIDITGYGILGYEAITRVETNVDGGKEFTASGVRLTSQTDRIPFKPGLAYGVRYVVKGAPDGALVDIEVVRRSSRPCIKANGEVVHTWVWVMKRKIGKEGYNGARFLAPGDENICINAEPEPNTVTIELRFEGRKLAEKTFEIFLE